MTHLEFVIPSWIIVVGGIGSYAMWTIRRGKALSKHVPEDQRRWS